MEGFDENLAVSDPQAKTKMGLGDVNGEEKVMSWSQQSRIKSREADTALSSTLG
jgi:hypothetical protein